MSTEAIPVFPLNTPLLPGCRLPLQIFEKRYLDMVAWCMKQDQGFVVTLLQPGSERREVIRPDQEATETTPFYGIGTLARIVDFGQRENGLLAISIEGGPRMELTDVSQQADGLWTAHPLPLPESGETGDSDLESLRDLLEQILRVNGMKDDAAEDYTSEQVMNYLVMLLPIPTTEKQELISCGNLHERWQGLKRAITGLIERQDESGPSSH
ncbi:MAG: peptidase S16 [Pseudomonadales bacterium]|nr:peptidase S16 [Pseudomonadales bacterium]